MQLSLSSQNGIDVAPAWPLMTKLEVPVAVIDTGVDPSQRDIAHSLWTNVGEIPGNGLDDEGNGYVDDVHGFDFASRAPAPVDDNGHGTAMASLIAAPGGDHVGMAGVAWSAKVMALKVTGSDGVPSDPAVA